MVGLGIALLFGALLAQQWAKRQRLRAAIQRHRAAIHAAGQPLTGRELWASGPNPSPERNWRLVVDPLLVTNHLQAFCWSGDIAVPLPEATLVSLSNSLRSNSVVLDFILKTDLSEMEWRGPTPADPDNVWSHRTPGIVQCIALCLVLGEKAVYEATSGHPDQATTALVRSFETAHVLNGSVIGAVGQVACEIHSLRALEATLKCAALSESDLLRVEAALPRRATNSLRQAIVQERVASICYCELARDHPYRFLRTLAPIPSGSALQTPFQAILAYLRQGFYRPSDYLGLLDRYARLERASLLPSRDGLAICRQVDREMLALDPKRTSLAVLYIEPKFTPLATDDAKNRSRLVMARTALAVERWRLRHDGKLPANLGELVPDYLPSLPLDPYDGQPVQFRPLPKGFAIWGARHDSGTTNTVGTAEEGVNFTVER